MQSHERRRFNHATLYYAVIAWLLSASKHFSPTVVCAFVLPAQTSQSHHSHCHPASPAFAKKKQKPYPLIRQQLVIYPQLKRLGSSRRKTRLCNNIFNDMLNFFDDMMENWNSEESKKARADQFNNIFPVKSLNDIQDEVYEDNHPAGSVRVVSIPVVSVKPGGLRLFLMFYLMGMQNTPNKGSWRANQPTTDEYVIDFWFHDRSAILTVTIEDKEVSIDRVGSAPSNAYMMQESLIVDGLLDELQTCAFDDTVEEINRLLILPEPKNAIEKAREALAFG